VDEKDEQDYGNVGFAHYAPLCSESGETDIDNVELEFDAAATIRGSEVWCTAMETSTETHQRRYYAAREPGHRQNARPVLPRQQRRDRRQCADRGYSRGGGPIPPVCAEEEQEFYENDMAFVDRDAVSARCMTTHTVCDDSDYDYDGEALSNIAPCSSHTIFKGNTADELVYEQYIRHIPPAHQKLFAILSDHKEPDLYPPRLP